MRKYYWFTLALTTPPNPMRSMSAVLLLAAALPSAAAVVVESFATDPALRGWRIFGDPSLFQWSAVNENLEVTWDSSRTNSYFYWPLGNILATADDFSLSFDLTLRDYAIGITPGQPYTFPVAIGFLNLDDAIRPDFSRGTGTSSMYGPKNLVEFDFFPEFDAFAPTIAQVTVSTNKVWLYNHNLLDMPPGDVFH